MSYLPIENHGVIGDLHTVALVGNDGTIDWLCLPHFDSPSVFAAILDDRKGGFFRISAASEEARRRQMYLPDTNVLVTRFLTPDGVGEVVDFMPVHPVSGKRDEEDHQVIRIVRCVRGALPFRMDCRPAFDYAEKPCRVEKTAWGARFRSDGRALDLLTPCALTLGIDDASAEFQLEAGGELAFILRQAGKLAPPIPSDVQSLALEAFRETVHFWQGWIARSHYAGHWREMVKRSCLTLKLLTFAPTGAIVAAATTSLPERMEGNRNWDYRYTWIRDAAFTLYSLIRVGFADEARAFVKYLLDRCAELEPGQGLHVLYAIDARKLAPERELAHLEGYRGSRPVRVGNNAENQLQLDITGDLVDALYLYDKYCEPLGYDVWKDLRRLVDWVCEHWREPDEGIWEVRGGRDHFTFSKMMCWVALDRAGRIAARRSLPCRREIWKGTRDEIYEAVMSRGWSATRRSFVQSFDGNALDASLLLAPMVKFVPPADPRMTGTLDAIIANLASDSLVHRYDPTLSPDGVGGEEGTFSMCTFWLAEALARAGRLEEARLIFEKMLGYANHLGLYSEQIGPTGEALGNFPQAFTHLALITAAYNISRILDGGPRGPEPMPLSEA